MGIMEKMETIGRVFSLSEFPKMGRPRGRRNQIECKEVMRGPSWGL